MVLRPPLSQADGKFLLSPDPTTEARRSLFGIPVHTSSQFSIDLTVGTATDCSWLAVADMSTIAVATNRRLAIQLSEHVAFSLDSVAIRSTSRWAIDTLAADGLKILTGLTTA